MNCFSNIQVGHYVIPSKNFCMADGEVSFTKGVPYEVYMVDGDIVTLIDDQGDHHDMEISEMVSELWGYHENLTDGEILDWYLSPHNQAPHPMVRQDIIRAMINEQGPIIVRQSFQAVGETCTGYLFSSLETLKLYDHPFEVLHILVRSFWSDGNTSYTLQDPT